MGTGGLAAAALHLLIAFTASLELLQWDSAALLTGVFIAGAAGVLAAVGPSNRAARIDPNTLLRAD